MTPRMTCIACLMLAAWAVFLTPSSASEGRGGLFPKQYEIHDTILVRAGEARLTVGWFFDVYDAAYYVDEPVQAESSITHDCAKRLDIRYLRGISRKDFIDAAEAMMDAYLTREDREKLQPAIERINAVYRDVEPGDMYSLTYVPGYGTELSLNGTSLVVVEGPDFARDYFRIWTDPSCKYETFRKDLLGI